MRRAARPAAGMTLVEVLIGIAILTFVCLGFFLSTLFATQRARANQNHLYALSLASFYQARVMASNFNRLGDPEVTSTAFEHQFTEEIEVAPDPLRESVLPVFTVEFEHTGWGKVATATGNTFTADFAENQSNWVEDEWKGRFVSIAEGRGAGQIMRIVSNTENTLTLTSDLTGTMSEGWETQPDSSSVYHIDGGKTVRLRVAWKNSKLSDKEPDRVVERALLVEPRTSHQ